MARSYESSFGNSIDEATARRYMTGLVQAGLNKLNYTYFIIDEPCFVGRDANGTLLENRTTWPNGLKSFGAELRSHGMKLGIYTCIGPKTCGGCIASEGHEVQDMNTFVEWGAEYVKTDSCSRNCTPAAGVQNATECGQILWSRYTRALNATGVPVVFSIVCNCDPSRGEQPWKWAADYANSWRTNIDVQVGFQAIPYIIDAQRRLSGNGSWCPATGTPCGGHGGPEQYAGPGHWNDMDMLIIGTKSQLFPRPLTVSQSRCQMSMWTILKSPLLASADFTNVTQDLIDVLSNKEVLAVSDDPLGHEAVRLEDQRGSASVGECYVGRTVDGYAAVYSAHDSCCSLYCKCGDSGMYSRIGWCSRRIQRNFYATWNFDRPRCKSC
eukprot:m.31727 g.31727  ORF g.31727 m.31727 type:complete len:382 (-) comp14025_c0_seq3:1217-2362(-)